MIEAGDEYYMCSCCGTEYEHKPCTCSVCKRSTRWLVMTKCEEEDCTKRLGNADQVTTRFSLRSEK